MHPSLLWIAGPRKESASRSLSGRPSVRETQLLLLRKTQGLPEGETTGTRVIRKLLVAKMMMIVQQLLRKRLRRLHLPLALPLTTTIQIRATHHIVSSPHCHCTIFTARHNVSRRYNCGARHTPRRTLTPRVAPRELRATQDNHLFVRNRFPRHSPVPLDRIRSTVKTAVTARLK